MPDSSDHFVFSKTWKKITKYYARQVGKTFYNYAGYMKKVLYLIHSKDKKMNYCIHLPPRATSMRNLVFQDAEQSEQQL